MLRWKKQHAPQLPFPRAGAIALVPSLSKEKFGTCPSPFALGFVAKEGRQGAARRSTRSKEQFNSINACYQEASVREVMTTNPYRLCFVTQSNKWLAQSSFLYSDCLIEGWKLTLLSKRLSRIRTGGYPLTNISENCPVSRTKSFGSDAFRQQRLLTVPAILGSVAFVLMLGAGLFGQEGGPDTSQTPPIVPVQSIPSATPASSPAAADSSSPQPPSDPLPQQP